MKYKPQPGTVPHHVAVGLAEVGYPNVVKPPGPSHPPHTLFAIPRGTAPAKLTHKALMLSALQRKGADALIRCLVHCRATDENKCPKYPVGALLAGTSRGCSPVGGRSCS